MITIVIAGYAVLMLTIVLALFGAATRRPMPKPPTVQFEEMPGRRPRKPVLMPTIPTSERGGTEVWVFEA